MKTTLWTLLLVTLLSSTGVVAQQQYPAKSVRVIVPFPPGGGPDVLARAVAQKLVPTWGQQMIVENRPGAGGAIGSQLASKADPDGYTLLVTSASTHSINPHLSRVSLYDALRDFAPVIHLASVANVLVVHPSVPARSVKELIAFAKSRPGELNYASNGSGTLSHLTGALFTLKTGIDMVHVPYKGGPPAVIDLVGGQVSALFATFPTVFGQVRAGRLRAIAITSIKPAAAAPALPTIAATVPGFESIQWFAMFAPTGTPNGIVNEINTKIAKIITNDDFKNRFAADAMEMVGDSPRDFAAFHKADYEKWGKVVKDAKIQPE